MTSQHTAAKEHLASRSNTAIEASKQGLFELSKDVHAHPELNYEEYYSADALAGFLEKQDLTVERGIGGVETAFRAIIPGGGGEGPTIAVLAEYDALPEIGHGCGHNLIAMAAMGAALGLKANAQDLPGRVMVIGTPAEEGGGGKIRLLQAGVFDGVDATLSSHPFSNRTIIPATAARGESWSLAMVGYRYVYHGKAAHAAAYPEEGINALNAVIHLFTGIDALRQHLRDDVRIHGVITDGGTAPNVVPQFAAANFMLRSRNGRYLSDEVVGKVRAVAEGAAAMTGARLEVVGVLPFLRERAAQRDPGPGSGGQRPGAGNQAGRPDSRETRQWGVHGLRQRQQGDAGLRAALRRQRDTGTFPYHSDAGDGGNRPGPLKRPAGGQGTEHDGRRPAARRRAGGGGQGRVRRPQGLRVKERSLESSLPLGVFGS